MRGDCCPDVNSRRLPCPSQQNRRWDLEKSIVIDPKVVVEEVTDAALTSKKVVVVEDKESLMTSKEKSKRDPVTKKSLNLQEKFTEGA